MKDNSLGLWPKTDVVKDFTLKILDDFRTVEIGIPPVAAGNIGLRPDTDFWPRIISDNSRGLLA